MQAIAAIAKEDAQGDRAEADAFRLTAVRANCVAGQFRETLHFSREPRLQLGVALVREFVCHWRKDARRLPSRAMRISSPSRTDAELRGRLRALCVGARPLAGCI